MEITIRTYDQFRDDRVKVEVSPGQRAEITIDGALSTVNETAQTAEVRDRSNGDLRRRIAELERSLAASLGREQTAERRADENREWAKRAEASLANTTQELTESRALVRQRDAIIHEHAKDLIESREFRAKERQEARQKISQLAGKLSEIRGRVHRPGVDDDLVFDADSEHYDNLVRVIRDIRQALSRTSDLSDTGA